MPNHLIIGVLKEKGLGETRVALTPDAIRKLKGKGFEIWVERSCGERAGFLDFHYEKEGATLVDASQACSAQIVVQVSVHAEEALSMKKGSLLISLMEPHFQSGLLDQLAKKGVDVLGMEWIPRTSKAQSMDVLSSQANIAGYRAVIEAASHYGRFFPLMMTSAGSAKFAKVMVLGVGVAGLQAIATAKRLGAAVEAYDVRPEVKEQILSLGAQCVELEIGESGLGQGGYAKDLSEDSKKKQQRLLTERLKKCDVIISTARVPGKKAPLLISEEAVQGMRAGSVIVDMATANGGNCSLSEVDKVVVKHHVKLIGYSNYPARMPTDASSFYANNLVSLLGVLVQKENLSAEKDLCLNLKDDIVSASLMVYQGEVRFSKLGST